MNNPPAVPRIVEMIRVSTQAQADRDTPEIQRRALDALRKRRPGALVERIEAPGVSGALSVQERPDLQRLAELSAERAYDELRVYALDRLTRADDPRERIAVYGMALDAGAIIVDVNGHSVDPKSEIGELDYYLQTWAASRERRKIRQRTYDGQVRAAVDGRLCHGSPPYGRRLDHSTGRWFVYEPEAAVYREIIAAVLSGRSTRAICTDLDARGVPPPRSARWATSTIKRLIHTEAAVGRYVVFGRPQPLPPICSVEEWQAARVALRSGKTRCGARPTREAMLRGLLRCPHCGRRMVVRTDAADSPAFYACPRARDLTHGEQPCPRRTRHRVDLVDEAVRAAVLALLDRPERLIAAVEAQTSTTERRRAEQAAEQARSALAAADEREQRVLRLLDVLSEQVARHRLAAITADRDAAREALRSAEERLASMVAPPTRDEVEQLARDLRERVRGADCAAWHDVLVSVLPRREPYGLTLSADREIGGLALIGAGDPARQATCSVQIASIVPMRISR